MSCYVVLFHPGDPIPDRLKFVDDVTWAPGPDDDGPSVGVSVGSLWIDQDAGKVYLCRDASPGAAVWTDLTGAGGTSDITSLLVDWVAGEWTVDRAVAATHDLTLVDDATLTPHHSAPPGGETIDLRVLVRQDGAGGHALAWDATITWAAGGAPVMPMAADALLAVGLLSVDDGATWLGSVAGDGLGVGVAGAVLRSTGTLPSWSHPRVPMTAGPPSDADVIGGAGDAADGMLVLDTANQRLYVRVGGTWRWAALT